MFDAAERMIICNDRYIEMYKLSRNIVKPGCSFRELLQPEPRTFGHQSRGGRKAGRRIVEAKP